VDLTDKKAGEKVKKLLKKHNQSHLLAFWEQLNAAQKRNLLVQIEGLDFAEIDRWVANYFRKPAAAGPRLASSRRAIIPEDLVPPPFYGCNPAEAEQKLKCERALELGGKLISSGRVAAFVVAGGQGTRLGFDGPKGNFPISPVKSKTLFQIFAEIIAATAKKYQTICTWYIMTSPSNHAETTETFRSNDYYGLNEKDVFIFQQGTLPSLDFDGKILLADKDALAYSPDGHGGSLKALYKSGAIGDMKSRGVEYISYFQVDNPLINIFDPLFIGLHALDQAEMSSKAVIKTGPKERVGVFALVGDKVNIIEYSDLPDELAEKRNPDGSLAFKLGSIAIHIINRDFVEKLNNAGFILPLHRAIKEIPYVDPQGNFVEPDRPNGVKLESFVFDALPLAAKSVILEALRSEEFAPVKNASGVDSVDSAREMMVARSAAWLESAGVAVPRRPDGSVDCLIEIAPGFALEKKDIKAKLSQIPEIKPMDRIYLA
jgi:UDP-N-acetylglucosamine/UDP-N-acetylgalactosamine diphosphorylase